MHAQDDPAVSKKQSQISFILNGNAFPYLFRSYRILVLAHRRWYRSACLMSNYLKEEVEAKTYGNLLSE